MRKYEPIKDEVSGLLRIKALVDIPSAGVTAGDLGGLIEKESNLSHAGDCWVFENARVFNNARAFENAQVSGDARVFRDARVSGNARVYGAVRVYGNARVFNNARVSGSALVYGNAQVYDDARVSGEAWVSEDARVFGNAQVFGDVRVVGETRVYGNAQVSGDARVRGTAWVSGEADISKTSHILTVGPIGSENRSLHLLKTSTGAIVTTGCFAGTLEEFEAAVKKKPEGDRHRAEYLETLSLLHMRVKLWAEL